MIMELTALTQLEKWILDYEKVSGTPTMWEIKEHIKIFKEVEQIQHRLTYHGGVANSENELSSIDYFNKNFLQKLNETISS